MKNITFLSLIISAFFIISCGGSSERRSGTASGRTGVTDSLKYIAIADAEKMLPSWKKDNVLIYHTIGEPDDMHPTNGNAAQRSEINLYTQMFLIRMDFHNLALKAGVAKDMPIEVHIAFLQLLLLHDHPRTMDNKIIARNDFPDEDSIAICFNFLISNNFYSRSIYNYNYE